MPPAKESAWAKSIAPCDRSHEGLPGRQTGAGVHGEKPQPMTRQQQLTASAAVRDSQERDTSGQQAYKTFLRSLSLIAAVFLFLWFLPFFSGTSRFKLLLGASLLGSAVMTLRDIRWVFLSFLIVLPVVKAVWKDFSVHIGPYPATFPSLWLWAVCLVWFLRKPRGEAPQGGPRYESGRITLLLSLMCASSLLALLAPPGEGNQSATTLAILVAGPVECLLLYAFTVSWLETYRDYDGFIYAIFISLVVSFGAGMMNQLANYGMVSYFDEFRRGWFMSLGGANHVGFILVLVYPLAFWFAGRRYPGIRWVICGLVCFCWIVALSSRSRATPVLMFLQTVMIAFWLRRQRWLIGLFCAMAVCGVIGVRFVPGEVSEKWKARFTDTDLVGYFLGHPAYLEEGDEQRQELQTRLGAEIARRPVGGFAATGEEDPENLYLDLALQLGWMPLFFLVALHLSLLAWAFQCARSTEPDVRAEGRIHATVFAGMIAYSATTGVNLCKVNIVEGITYVSGTCGSYMALILAFAHARTGVIDSARGAIRLRQRRLPGKGSPASGAGERATDEAGAAQPQRAP